MTDDPSSQAQSVAEAPPGTPEHCHRCALDLIDVLSNEINRLLALSATPYCAICDEPHRSCESYGPKVEQS